MNAELREHLRAAMDKALDDWMRDGEGDDAGFLADAALAALPTAPGVTVEFRTVLWPNSTEDRRALRPERGVEVIQRHEADPEKFGVETRVCLPWQPAPKEKP